MFPQMANQFRFNNIILQLFRAKKRFAFRFPLGFLGLVTSKLPSKTTLTRNKSLIWFDMSPHMLFSWNHLKTHHCPVMWPLCCLVVSATGRFFFRWRAMIRFPWFCCVSIVLAVFFKHRDQAPRKKFEFAKDVAKGCTSREGQTTSWCHPKDDRGEIVWATVVWGGCCRSLIQLTIICRMKIYCKSRLFVSIDMFMHDDDLNHGDMNHHITWLHLHLRYHS